MLVRWLLIALLVLLLFRAISRLIAGILQGAGYATQDPRRGDRPGVSLVRDPACGMFVVPSRAISVGSGTSRQFFCSERCRDRYLADRQRT